jgi:hypothetical protein
MSKEQMAEALRNENVHEDTVDDTTREDFKKEVPKNCSLQYARTRALLWKELVAQLELQATVEKSGSSGHTGSGAGGAVACANPSGTGSANVSVHRSVEHNTMLQSERIQDDHVSHTQGQGQGQGHTVMTRVIQRSPANSRQSSEQEVSSRLPL